MNNTLSEIITSRYKSKAEFARDIGVSRWTVYNWCLDPNVIRLKHWVKIAELTGIPLSELLVGNKS